MCLQLYCFATLYNCELNEIVLYVLNTMYSKSLDSFSWITLENKFNNYFNQIMRSIKMII